MKRCLDCAHFKPVVWCYSGILGNFPSGSESSLQDACLLNMKTDPVSGKKIFQYARQVRSDEKRCGAEGKWFAPITAGQHSEK